MFAIILQYSYGNIVRNLSLVDSADLLVTDACDQPEPVTYCALLSNIVFHDIYHEGIG